MKNENRLDQQLEKEFSEDVLDLRQKLSAITGANASDIGKTAVNSETVKKEPVAGKKSTLRLLLPILAVAASLVLAIIFVPGLMSEGDKDLYATYYESYPMALNQRGDAEAELNNAVGDYLSGDYRKAASGFRSLWNSTGDAVFLLYQGTSLLELGSYEEAVRLFNNVFRTNDETVIEQAQWYKALALIKLERNSEALVLLESFSEKHYKYDQAQKIIKSKRLQTR